MSVEPALCWEEWLSATTADLRQRHLLRVLRPTLPRSSPVEVGITVAQLEAWCCGDATPSLALPSLAHRTDVRTIKLFSLNDYLGLSTHPAVCRASADAALACGNGPRSSALVAGHTVYHRELELALAELKEQEDCLLFPTGFAANVSVAATLADAADVAIFSDELNHASIVDGVALGRRRGASLQVYRHNDMRHLEELLEACPSGMRRLVLTDSLFSMDGDYANLPALARLKDRHGFLLALDDAHGTLVCGNGGGGVAQMMGLEHAVDLHIGTLSKAFGCMGGFVACSRAWRALLANKGRPQVFSTALPVPTVAAAAAALRVSQQEPWRRHHLVRLSRQLGGPLGLPPRSPILPLVLGPEGRTMEAAASLLRAGFHVGAIRPPTVPVGTSRLRISLSAGHTSEDVGALLAAMANCGLVQYGLLLQHAAWACNGAAGAATGQASVASSSSSCDGSEEPAWEWEAGLELKSSSAAVAPCARL